MTGVRPPAVRVTGDECDHGAGRVAPESLIVFELVLVDALDSLDTEDSFRSIGVANRVGRSGLHAAQVVEHVGSVVRDVSGQDAHTLLTG